MSQKPELVQPRETVIVLADGTLAFAMVDRGGAYSKNGVRPIFAAGAFQHFLFRSDEGNYLLAYPWDGAMASAIPVPILKDPKLSILVSAETLLGAVANYTYSFVAAVGTVPGYYVRAASYSGKNENQVIIPQFQAGESVFGATVNGNLVTPIGAGVLIAPQTCLGATIATPGAGVTAGTYAIAGGTVTAGAFATKLTIGVASGVVTAVAVADNGHAGKNGIYDIVPGNPVGLTGVSATVQPTFNLTWSGQILDTNRARYWTKIPS